MNICVFGASSSSIDKKYKQIAYDLGCVIAKSNHTIVFGAGSVGMMGALAQGAAECKGTIIGILPEKLNRPGIASEHCTQIIVTSTMHERKERMESMADAFIALPGGFGTLEELLEVITLKQLGYIDIPICVLNAYGYWDALVEVFENSVREKFNAREHLSLCEFVHSPDEALKYIYEYVRQLSIDKIKVETTGD